MSDTPTLIPGTNPAGTPAEGDPLSPPDDLGASVLAEFARREKATAAALGKDLGDGPPGGFPDVNDANVTNRVDVSQAASSPSSTASVVGGDDASVAGEGEPTADASSTPAEVTTPPAVVVPGDTTAPASTPAADEGVVGAPEGGDGAPESPSGYTYRYHDGQQEQALQFDDAHVQRALSLDQWARNLSPEVQQAFGAIETGQSVAIPRADFDEFAAWKAQQSRTTRDADLNQLDLDPAVADILRKQRDEIDALKNQPTQPPGSVDPRYQAQVSAGADRTVVEMKTAMDTYAQTRGLTAEEAEGLLGAAVHAQIIPSLVEANTQFNPANGSVLVPADMGRVTEEALDWALIRNPHLKTRILAGQQAPGQVQQGAQLPPGVPAAPDPVQARKARAGSLASAPSGAAPSMPPQAIQQMAPQDITNAMARDIEAILKS